MNDNNNGAREMASRVASAKSWQIIHHIELGRVELLWPRIPGLEITVDLAAAREGAQSVILEASIPMEWPCTIGREQRP